MHGVVVGRTEEAATRIRFEVPIDILADMGGICVEGHLGSGTPTGMDHAFFENAALWGCVAQPSWRPEIRSSAMKPLCSWGSPKKARISRQHIAKEKK